MKSNFAICLLNLCFVTMLGCEDDGESPAVEDTNPTSDTSSPDDGVSDVVDADVTCDSNCLADRFLAMHLAMEPACRCNGMSGSSVLTAERVTDCSIVAAEEASEFFSPRECIAQFASNPETAAELESWIACREERLRSRGPCIMELQAGESCDQCPSFWEADRVDPCQSPQDEDVVVTCYDQMSGRPWE